MTCLLGIFHFVCERDGSGRFISDTSFVFLQVPIINQTSRKLKYSNCVLCMRKNLVGSSFVRCITGFLWVTLNYVSDQVEVGGPDKRFVTDAKRVNEVIGFNVSPQRRTEHLQATPWFVFSEVFLTIDLS